MIALRNQCLQTRTIRPIDDLRTHCRHRCFRRIENCRQRWKSRTHKCAFDPINRVIEMFFTGKMREHDEGETPVAVFQSSSISFAQQNLKLIGNLNQLLKITIIAKPILNRLFGDLLDRAGAMPSQLLLKPSPFQRRGGDWLKPCGKRHEQVRNSQ